MVKRGKIGPVGQQCWVNQGLAVPHDLGSLLGVGQVYHNVRGNFGTASQNRSVAPLQFHLAQTTYTFASTRQLEIEYAGAQRRLVDQGAFRHLGHNVSGLETNQWHRLTVLPAVSGTRPDRKIRWGRPELPSRAALPPPHR